MNIESHAIPEYASGANDGLFARIVDVAPNGMILVDDAGTIVVTNRHAETLFGYLRQELLGRPLQTLFADRFRNRLVKDSGNGPVTPFAPDLESSYALFGLRKDGSEIPVEIRLTAIETEARSLFLVSILDIREKQRAEDDFRVLVEGVQDYAIFMLDPRGRVASWNQGAELLKGYATDEILGRHFAVFYPPEDVAAGKPGTVLRVAEKLGRTENEGWRIRKDGSRFWASITITACRDECGGLRGFLKITRDLTARKFTEDRLRTVIDAAPNAMIMVDFSGMIVFANLETEKLFGHKVNDLTGKPIETLIPAPAREVHSNHRRKYFENPRTRAMGAARELYGLHSNGSLIPVEIRLNPLQTPEGRFILASILDITERKKNETILASREAALEASRMKSQFLANMSHEIRTPLNGIIAMTGFLLECGLPSEQQELAETIRISSEGLLSIVNDILDFSKIEAGKLELERIDFDLNVVVADLKKIATFEAIRKNIAFEAAMPQFTRSLKGDPNRLRQILSNLINNAIKFTPQGCVQLHITAQAHTDARLLIRFEIKDTGIGIAETSLHRLFTEFSQADDSTTRRFGGTGLGLSICKRLVALMGGEIGVHSVEGKGSTFWFELTFDQGQPLEKTSGKPERPKPRPRTTKLPGIRVLVAEDNPINRKVIVKLFKKIGLTADVVLNGREALTAQSQNSYDLIMMDCQMPEMDGYEATRKLRKRELDEALSPAKVIALTAHAAAGEREKCLEAGMDDHIAKPITERVLCETLACHFDYSPPQDSDRPNPDKTICDLKKALEIVDGDRALLVEMIELFLQEAPSCLEALGNALTDEDWQTLEETAHSVKGMVTHFNAMRCWDLAASLEQEARSGSRKTIDERTGQLTSAMRELISTLQERKIDV